MRYKFGNFLWALVFILIGVGYFGDALDVWDFNLFFNGWWTLFIIVPFTISIIQSGFNIVNIFGVVIGVLLLLNEQQVLPSHIIPKIIFPLILILIGVNILFKNTFFKTKNLNFNKEGFAKAFAILGGQAIRPMREKFTGADVTAVLGGMTVDLSGAILEGDVYINSTTILGGIDIYLPPNVVVKVKGMPILGGIDNKSNPPMGQIIATVYVNATCVMGGVEIKTKFS